MYRKSSFSLPKRYFVPHKPTLRRTYSTVITNPPHQDQSTKTQALLANKIANKLISEYQLKKEKNSSYSNKDELELIISELAVSGNVKEVQNWLKEMKNEKMIPNIQVYSE